jgi:hypothetical protein
LAGRNGGTERLWAAVVAYEAVNYSVWLVSAAVAGVLSGGCKSDQTVICERLNECHLLPITPPTAADPNGFQLKDCEYQVESELSSDNRDKCSACVTGHSCETLQDACRAVCNPPY